VATKQNTVNFPKGFKGKLLMSTWQ